jgi:hypothetical protein
MPEHFPEKKLLEHSKGAHSSVSEDFSSLPLDFRPFFTFLCGVDGGVTKEFDLGLLWLLLL